MPKKGASHSDWYRFLFLLRLELARGRSLAESLFHLIPGMAPPFKAEITRILNEVRIGVPFPESVAKWGSDSSGLLPGLVVEAMTAIHREEFHYHSRLDPVRALEPLFSLLNPGNPLAPHAIRGNRPGERTPSPDDIPAQERLAPFLGDLSNAKLAVLISGPRGAREDFRAALKTKFRINGLIDPLEQDAGGITVSEAMLASHPVRIAVEEGERGRPRVLGVEGVRAFSDGRRIHQVIFRRVKTGIRADRSLISHFECPGLIPHFMEMPGSESLSFSHYAPGVWSEE